MVKYRLNWMLLLALALAPACGPAEDVRVQALPSLRRSTPEARAGVPELRGVWRFAGWELAENDSAGLAAPLPGFGMVWLRTQKRDSLAGSYVVPGGRVPLLGEIRRDSVVALVAMFGPGDSRYLAGRVRGDTLWVGLTSLTDPTAWPAEARAAFVRSQGQVAAAAPFKRMKGQLPPPPAPPAVDTTVRVAALDSAASAVPPGPWRAAVAPPAAATPPAGAYPSAVPPGPWRTPPAAAAPAAPAPSPPADDRPAEPTDEPDEPPAEPAEPEELPPLLGDPIPGEGNGP